MLPGTLFLILMHVASLLAQEASLTWAAFQEADPVLMAAPSYHFVTLHIVTPVLGVFCTGLCLSNRLNHVHWLVD